jgi:UDP-glucose 4-epimerase
VYGDNPNLPLTEDSVTQPLSPYGLDNLACEWQAAMGARCLGLKSAGMRFFNVYGPRQDPASPYSGVISIFNARLHKGQDITIFGDGEQSRDFIYVGDVVRYLVAALELLQGGYGEATVFNVCTETVTSIKDLASVMIHISEKESQIVYEAARAGDILHSCGSAAKAESLLQITAATPLLEGLTYLWHSIS